MPINVPITITGAATKDFKPLPKDVYPFELIDIELVNEQAWQSEEMVDKLKFEFACLDEAFYGRRIWQRATLKLTSGKKPSTLFTLLSEILGREITKDELKTPAKFLSAEFLNTLIGVQLRLSLGLKAPNNEGKVNNSVDSFLPKKQDYPAFDKEKSKALAEKAKAEWKPEPDEAPLAPPQM